MASKFAQLAKEAREIEAELHQISEEMRTKAEAVEHLEAAHRSARSADMRWKREVNQNRERMSAIALENDRSTARAREQ